MTRVLPDDWQEVHGWNFWGDYESGSWEPGTRARIEEFVSADSTYVDIGAWIGPTVLWAAPLCKRVVAVEPDPVARACLAANCAHYRHIDIVGAAIGPETGRAQFTPHSSGWGASMSRLVGAGVPISSTWSTDLAEEVDCYTLPDLFELYAIEDVALLKMDIEGGEAEILEEVCPFLAERGIPFLCSLHKDWWNAPVDMAWFDCFGEVIDIDGGAPEVLAIP